MHPVGLRWPTGHKPGFKIIHMGRFLVISEITSCNKLYSNGTYVRQNKSAILPAIADNCLALRKFHISVGLKFIVAVNCSWLY